MLGAPRPVDDRRPELGSVVDGIAEPLVEVGQPIDREQEKTRFQPILATT